MAQPRLLKAHGELLEAMRRVVQGAQRCLVVTGSRSRDVAYLDGVCQVESDRGM